MVKEKWVDVKNYEGLYQVSNLGRIRSLPRATTSGRILKEHINSRNNYSYISLCKENVKKTLRIHVLVMNSFNPICEKMQINHIDGVKTNNNINNLEWISQSDNMKHAYKIGLEKVTWNKKIIRLDDGKIYESVTDSAKDNGAIKGSCITRVCSGKRSNYKGKRFAYYEDFIKNTIPKFKGKFKKNGVL